MDPLTLFGFPESTYTQTARLVAEELGIATRLVPIAYHEPSHYRLHPYGKMPALEHGELKLFETLAIASYMAEHLGEGRLLARNAVDRARSLGWVSAAVDYAYRDLVSPLHSESPGAPALAAAAQQLKLLDAGLDGRAYFGGVELGLADFFLLPMVHFAVGKLGFPELDGLPALGAWRTRLLDRPSSRVLFGA